MQRQPLGIQEPGECKTIRCLQNFGEGFGNSQLQELVKRRGTRWYWNTCETEKREIPCWTGCFQWDLQKRLILFSSNCCLQICPVESAFLFPGQYHSLILYFFFPTKNSLIANSNSLLVFKSPVQSKSNPCSHVYLLSSDKVSCYIWGRKMWLCFVVYFIFFWIRRTVAKTWVGNFAFYMHAHLFFVINLLLPPSCKWGNWNLEDEVSFSKVLFSLFLPLIFPIKAAFYTYHLDFILKVSLHQFCPIEILPVFLSSHLFLLALKGCQWIKPSLSSSPLLIKRLNRLLPRAEPEVLCQRTLLMLYPFIL